MTPAALDGIEAFGHRWRFSIHLSDQTSRLADEDALRVGDAEAIGQTIGRRLAAWVAETPKLDDDMRYRFGEHAEELGDIEDDLDEVRYALNRLYDDFDFFRVCVS